MKRISWLLTSALVLQGCATMKPDYLEAAYVHQSHPMAGTGPEPFGGSRPETTLDGIAGSLRWERGALFGDALLGYSLRDRNMQGGSLFAEFRAGIRMRL